MKSDAEPDTRKPDSKDAAINKYDFDSFDGKLFRVFEGSVFEGVVTNHIDGGLAGPILIMLTTDYYSQRSSAIAVAAGHPTTPVCTRTTRKRWVSGWRRTLRRAPPWTSSKKVRVKRSGRPVGAFRSNDSTTATESLKQQGRVHEYANSEHRQAAIALDYASQIDRAVIVAPDAAERRN